MLAFFLGGNAESKSDWLVPHVHLYITMHRVQICHLRGYLWSVAHESLIIFTGSRHRGLFIVEVLSQTGAQTGRPRFIGGNGALCAVRGSFAKK